MKRNETNSWTRGSEFWALGLIVLAACGSTGPAPVETEAVFESPDVADEEPAVDVELREQLDVMRDALVLDEPSEEFPGEALDETGVAAGHVHEQAFAPGDELTGDELAGDELTGDELTGDELTGDELTGDELAADELAGDGAVVADPALELADLEAANEQVFEEIGARTEEEVEEQIQGLFLDPGQLFPVEMIDGVPMTNTMVVETLPEPESAPPIETFENEVVPEVALDLPVELAMDLVYDGPELLLEEALAQAAFGEATEDGDPASEALELVAVELAPEDEPNEIADETVVVELDTPGDAVAQASTEEVAVGPDGEALVETDLQPELDEVVAAVVEQLDSEQSVADAQPETAEQPGEVLAQLEESPELIEPDGMIEVEVEFSAPALVWEQAPAEFDPTDIPASLQAMAVTPELVELSTFHAGLYEPEPTFEPIPEPAVEPLVEPEPAPMPVPAHLAWIELLDPVERALVVPLLLLDPSGFTGSMTVGLPMAGDSLANVLFPQEVIDPAYAALPGQRRIDGSQFGSGEAEGLLTEEPGLGMIWWGTEIPSAHVDKPLDVQTPSVGRVRIVLSSGDYVEGVLHAVGQGDYWIDGDLGRFAVGAALVSHVERLPKPGLGAEVKGLQAGDLVRVKAASGFVQGRLVSMKGTDVLIETADGMRVTLSGADVEPIGESPTRVVLP